MNRTTIDFGIDLGTTNSAIAVLNGVAPEVIKNNGDADITPSAVSIDKRGVLQVGLRARNRLIDAPEDAYAEFKRRMGGSHVYEFKASGQRRSPEELSAEVLKSLRADVQQRLNESVDAAVITVPAAFELHQCEATQRAAQLAGFAQDALLQEPVAAALAYGFQGGDRQGYWLVYDFGGGTFDAAVVQSKDGAIQVVNHGGDNFLGGSDIDWAIVEELLVPRLLEHHLLTDFRRGNPFWRQAFAKLKRAAETAKIDLSRSERTGLETCRFEDEAGREIEFDADLSRSHVVRVAEPIVRRSVDICKRVLTEKGLEPAAVERVILVGGPTLAPYFREMLAAGLGIPLDWSVDPLTVVAKGAAVFAGTQKRRVPAHAPASASTFSVALTHPSAGADDQPFVGGKVSGPAGEDLAGFCVEITNRRTQWRSGRAPLDAGGVFMMSVQANPGGRNVFHIELWDGAGVGRPVSPDEFHYTIGAVVDEQPLIHSMGVALANNHYDRFFEKGSGLPVRAARNFRTVSPLQTGDHGVLLRIPLVEGENALADRNRKVGELRIEAKSLARSLPSGSDVEVTVSVSADRIIRISAYVPLLDEHFEGRIDMGKQDAGYEGLKADYDLEMKRFRAAMEKSATPGAPAPVPAVEAIERSPLMAEVRRLMDSAKADPDAAAKCERRLLELKLALDEAVDQAEWPALIQRARGAMREVHACLRRCGTAAHRARAAELSDEIEQSIREHQAQRLRNKIEQAGALWSEAASLEPDYWALLFRVAESKRLTMTDQARAALLLEQGRECIARNNMAVLQGVVSQLFDLLPKEALQAAQRGYQSGLIG